MVPDIHLGHQLRSGGRREGQEGKGQGSPSARPGRVVLARGPEEGLLWQDGGPRDQHEWEGTVCFKKEKQANNRGENSFQFMGVRVWDTQLSGAVGNLTAQK